MLTILQCTYSLQTQKSIFPQMLSMPKLRNAKIEEKGVLEAEKKWLIHTEAIQEKEKSRGGDYLGGTLKDQNISDQILKSGGYGGGGGERERERTWDWKSRLRKSPALKQGKRLESYSNSVSLFHLPKPSPVHITLNVGRRYFLNSFEFLQVSSCLT